MQALSPKTAEAWEILKGQELLQMFLPSHPLGGSSRLEALKSHLEHKDLFKGRRHRLI